MAYLDLSNFGTGSDISSLPAGPRRVDVRLTAFERDIVRVARHDPVSSVGPVTRMRALAGRIFGLARPNALAAPRLEALRRFAIFCARGDQRADAQHSTLSEAGYSAGQIAEARRLATPRRAPLQRSCSSLVAPLTAALLSAAAYAWIKSRVGDSMIAAIIAAYLGLPLVISVRPRVRAA